MADKREILISLLGEETVARMADRAGDGLERFGDKLDATEKDAQDLDRQIGEVEGSLKTLATAFARTSDAADRVDLTKAIRRQQTELRKLTKARGLLDVGAEMAETVSVSFAARLGPMLARAPMAGMNPAALAIGAPIAAGIATLVGTAVGGAIIGAAGVGGVVGGLALAAKDPAVKAAGTELGADLSAMLGRSSSAFVPATLGAIDTIRKRTIGMERDFNRAFTSAARYVDPLVDGLLDAAENAMPGLIDAIDAAGPVIEVVAEGAAKLGEAIGEGLSDLAPYADEGARALQTLFGVMIWGVDAAFEMVESMSRLYKVAELVGALLNGDIPRFIALATSQKDAAASSTELTGVLGPLMSGLRDVGTEAMTGEQAVNELKAAFDAIFDENMAYDRAIIAVKDGTKELNKELREGKRTLNENTAAGRENRTAVLDQIEKVNGLRDAMIRQGKPMDEVNGKYRDGIAKIREKLEKMGFEKTEIDKLIGKYEDIPRQVSTRVSAETAQAEQNLADVRNLIAQIKSKRVVITTDYRGRQTTRSEGRNVGIGDGIGGRASGGPVRAGTPYIVGEEGPELITPARDGFVHDARKTAAMLAASKVAGRAPAMSAVAGGGSTVNHYSISVSVAAGANLAEAGRQVVEQIKAYERGNGKGWRAP